MAHPKTRTEVIVRSDFSWMEPALWEWTHRVNRYALAWSTREDGTRDAAYWHGEQATLSTLLAAFAATGADVLGEYRCRRKRANSSSQDVLGRTDFWCQVGRHQAIIEAKQAVVSNSTQLLNSSAGAHSQAGAQLLSALDDADPAAHLLTATFLIPQLRYSPNISGQEWASFADAALSFANAALSTNLAFPAIAWSFPEAAKSLRGFGNFDMVFPGVALIVREQLRSSDR